VSKKKHLLSSAQTPPRYTPSETLAQFASAAHHFSGPLPPPEILKKYEELLSGSANRIFVMAEGQSQHRQTLEKKVVESNCFNERLRMALGFAICVLAISLVMRGKDASGIAAIVGALAAPVAVFI
jgi:uncharacterized membrane protein